MKRNNMMPIDPERLRNELKKRGLSIGGAGIEIGYSANYMNNNLSRKNISHAGIVAMEKVFNLKYDDYKPIQEAPTDYAFRDVVEAPADPIDYDRLYKTIYAAVYEAMKKVWNE